MIALHHPIMTVVTAFHYSRLQIDLSSFTLLKQKCRKVYIIVFYKICISTHHGFLQEGTHEKRVRRLNYCITCLCKDETKCSFQDVFIETQCLSCNVASVPLI